MRKLVIFLGLMFLLIPFSSALEINSFDTYLEDSKTSIFGENQTVNFRVNASNSSTSELTVKDSNGNDVIQDQQMNKVEDSNYQVYSYNYSLSSSPGGGWDATVNVSNESWSRESLSFHVATDKPRFYSLDATPSYIKVNDTTTIEATVTDAGEDLDQITLDIDEGSSYSMTHMENDSGVYSYELNITPEEFGLYEFNATARDEGGKTSSSQGTFTAFKAPESVDVTVEVAPLCSSGLSYFLVPGDGEIVQNKTGVFVEILENSGNVESNITIEYLDVTKEGDEAWSKGNLKGPVIKSYEGETFENVRKGEDVTYFKLFQASYEFGNYTGRSAVTTECSAKGVQNQTEEKDYLKENFEGENVSQDNFTRFDVSVLDTSFQTAEVTTATFNNTTSKTVSEQSSGTEAFKSDITLNSTGYDVYAFNGTSTSEYDYSCASENDTIYDEDAQCAYEDNIIGEYSIELSEMAFNGDNATYSLQEESEDKLNKTLKCESIDNQTANCDRFLSFFEEFSFFGNFEIVDAIGEESGGVNNTGNQTTNQTIAGNNSKPGQTEVTVPEPEPEPVPEPEPEPEPDPVVKLDIESVKDRHSTKQGQFVAAEFEVQNIGNTEVSDVNLVPLTDQLPGQWDTRNAVVTNLSVNETVRREVFLRPPDEAEPRNYVVPVTADKNGDKLDLDYFTLNVKKADFLPEVEIREAPRRIQLNTGSEKSFPVLVENTGKLELEAINARIQNIEDCGAMEAEKIASLNVNSTGSLEIDVTASDRPEECDATLVVSSENGAYAFGDITIETVPEAGLIPKEQRVPFIAIIWTFVLMIYAYATREYDLESMAVRLPFIALIMGESIIILYSIVNYYGLEVATLLPF